MPYTIEWNTTGAVKRFHGKVGYAEVLASEKEISGSAHFTSLRYVISDYSGAEYNGITESQKADINALRIGGYWVNKNIKYAFVLHNPDVQAQIRAAIANQEMLYETRVFSCFDEAARWAGLAPKADKAA